MYILCVIIALRIIASECRVFCQDINATPWKPLGFSCPVRCENVLAAVERLKIQDYEELLDFDPKTIPINVTLDYLELDTKLTTTERHFPLKHDGKNNFKFTSILKLHTDQPGTPTMSVRNNINLIDRDDSNMVNKRFDNEMCPMLLKKAYHDYRILKKLRLCSRRSDYKDNIVKTITNILNNFTRSDNKFTESITTVLLQKLFDKNVDLRNGELDIQKLVYYLKSAIKHHRKKKKQNFVIQLEPKNCLTTFVSGCFCNSGYVEDSGQCVKPKDCRIGAANQEYLARITVS